MTISRRDHPSAKCPDVATDNPTGIQKPGDGPAFTFPGDSDLPIQKEFHKEYFQLHYPQLDLLILDRENTEVCDTYDETEEFIFFNPIKVHAYVEHQPSEQELMKYGIDEQRDVLFHMSTPLLEEQGLLSGEGDGSAWLLGSRMVFDNDEYEIKSQHRATDGYWANTNVAFVIVVSGLRVREGR